jgi:Fur family ferric uptake transcriptional regulator
MASSLNPLPSELHYALEKLSAAGYKLTTPRLAVLHAARTFTGAFTAAQLEEQLDHQGTPLGDASLFRTLKLYTDVGIMQRIHGFSECHRYILSPQTHAHRIVCTACGCVAEFAECDLGQLINSLERHTGFHVENHLLELFGTCPNCRIALHQASASAS